MPTYLPTRSQQTHHWEGGQNPPLQMADGLPQRARSYSPAPVTTPTATPVAKATAVTAAPHIRDAGGKFLRQLVVVLLFGCLCLAAYYAISRYFITPVIIQGRSMTPTLRDGECYFLNRWSYRFNEPERGDLVVIKDPGHNDFAIKRIIAKPGDWLNLKGGNVILNGKVLVEPYLPKGTSTRTADAQEKWIELGAGHYYVMGDNRAFSEDSRVYGAIQRGSIVGTVRN